MNIIGPDNKVINNESILTDDNNRFTVFPLKYKKLYDLFLLHVSTFWAPNDLDFTTDINDWKKLNDNEKHFLKYIFAFFAASDGLVSENIVLRFYNDVKHADIRLFYGVQLAIEGIHGVVYSQLIDTFIEEIDEKNKLFNAINNIPCIIKKTNWIKKWIQETDCFAKRLIAFAIIEGVFFSGAFCAIYYIVINKKIMPTLREANTYIARDENLHCQFACKLYHELTNKLDKEVVYDLIKEAVDIENEFINDSLPCSLIGMNSALMLIYIKFCADRILMQLGYDPLFNVKNPFQFMEFICYDSQTNFFDNRSADYTKSKETINKDIITFTDDF